MNVYIKHFGTGIPLVFFHGWGFDHSIWMSLVPKLQDHFEIFLVDLPGFGRTDRMHWNAFKNTLLSQLPRTFALIGWSMGGLFATRFALEAPLRVSYLLNVNSTPYFMQEPTWPGISKAVFSEFYRRLLLNSDDTLQEFVNLQCRASHVSFSMPVTASQEGLQEGLQVLQQWDLREAIETLQPPTRYIFGRLDKIIPFKIMDIMQLQYPIFNYTLINKAAHMSFLSHSEAFIKEVFEFII